MPGKSVIPTGLPCRTSHSSARVAFPLAFLGSFPPKESSSVELLSALCCGFLALTSQALSILHSGYFKRGSFVTKTGSCSCRRNKSPFDSFSALFPQLLVISKSEAYPFSCLMSLVSFIYENTAAAAAKSLQSCVRLCATPETAAHQAPPYPGFSRQECWSGLPFPSPVHANKVTQSYQTLATPWLQPSLPAPTRGRGHTPSSSLVLGPPPARPTSQTPTGSSGLHPLPQLKRVEPSCGGAWGQPLRGPLHPSAACRLGNGLGVRVAS